MWGDAAAEALGLSLDAWWMAVNHCPWFTIDHAGPVGWALTDRGRAEALEAPK
jgi:hypothetical protein